MKSSKMKDAGNVRLPASQLAKLPARLEINPAKINRFFKKLRLQLF